MPTEKVNVVMGAPRMTPERLFEIRERVILCDLTKPGAQQAQFDREELLAEVDRLRAVGQALADRANRLDRILDELSGELRNLADKAHESRM